LSRGGKTGIRGFADASALHFDIHTPFSEMLVAAYRAERDNLEEEGKFLEQLYRELEKE